MNGKSRKADAEMNGIHGLSRSYVSDNINNGKDPVIEYYDYDFIDENGCSKVYRFTLSRKTYRSIENDITEKGRDDDPLLIDRFTEYCGWNDLKDYFDENGIVYRYEEISLSATERIEKQREQFGEHRCARIHCSRDMNDPTLNEYEKQYLHELLRFPDVAWDIPFGWEEQDFKFLRPKVVYYYLNDIDALGKSVNWDFFIYSKGSWQKDTDMKIPDRLNGYDPYEPEDSPYGFGSTSVMDTIRQISRKEAVEFIDKRRGRS